MSGGCSKGASLKKTRNRETNSESARLDAAKIPTRIIWGPPVQTRDSPWEYPPGEEI